jgi:hypothetical protein
MTFLPRYILSGRLCSANTTKHLTTHFCIAACQGLQPVVQLEHHILMANALPDAPNADTLRVGPYNGYCVAKLAFGSAVSVCSTLKRTQEGTHAHATQPRATQRLTRSKVLLVHQ